MSDFPALIKPQDARSQPRHGAGQLSTLADEARSIAAAVRRIGRGRGSSPEAALIEKHEAADRLFALAARMEGGGW